VIQLDEIEHRYACVFATEHTRETFATKMLPLRMDSAVQLILPSYRSSSLKRQSEEKCRKDSDSFHIIKVFHLLLSFDNVFSQCKTWLPKNHERIYHALHSVKYRFDK
jgi:hypothetical protein